MFEVRFYVMALYATKPSGGAPDAGEHEVSLRVAITLASSEEEAGEKGEARLLEWCPPAEGWVNHHVTLNHVPGEALARALRAISDHSPATEVSDSPDGPELLM